MQTQFLAAINELCEQKGLSKDLVIDIVKAALRAAYRKDFGTREQNIEIELNDTGNFATVLLVKEVVEKVEDEEMQMSVEEAKKLKKGAKVGDVIKMDVTPVG